ncbi:efflux transporter, outer membrane factor (OMF) lipoprotein, NodT family [Pricia antarctica]|uniref:Efflux transporter, outer membrane factor (OMF) lipoprotein, NodT family n=1 Tax=Pricia antarctica TaxID=641691 RepID=A0A1G7HBW1_9FLAO|nr:TolC family protein [Pricia antarctica]SDE97599.1 efflux transporter, outer membrane factor (OMF) lipoprotein, NodT family [Pricia antarctica]
MKINSLYRFLFITVLPLLLVSCFAAKTYERPEVVTEANFRTDNLPQDSLTMATVPWTAMFTDPTLQDYIEEGLAENIDIRIALQRILAAEAYVKQGKAGFLPTLQGSTQYSHQELSGNSQFGGQFNTLDQYQVSAGLSWEADIWGKIRSNKRAFQATYLQSVAAHQAVKTDLIANIATLYYQLLSLDEQVRITEETVRTRKNSLETTQALKEAGTLTAVAVKQTEAQYYTAQGILIDLNNQSRLVENTLSILLGKEPGDIQRTTLDTQEITTELNVGVPIQLVRNRPDVMAAEYDLVNAFELTNVARSDFYPSLTLDATGGLQSLDFSDLFDSTSLFASIMSGLTQPIFNGRKIRTQYEVSQAQQEEARLSFRRAILTASKEVSDALFGYQAATAKIDVKNKEYDAYSTATEYSEQLLNNGLANYLEVLNARENALRSSLDLIDARFSQLQSIVNLYEAVGGGWQ